MRERERVCVCVGGGGGEGAGGKNEKGDKQVFLILRLQLDEYSNVVSVTCDLVKAHVVVVIAVVVVMRFSGGGVVRGVDTVVCVYILHSVYNTSEYI